MEDNVKNEQKTDRQISLSVERVPDGEVQPSTDLTVVTGAADPDVALHLANQLVSTLWLPAGIDENEEQRRIDAALSMLKGIKPQNDLEGVLGAQMIAAHEAAMECLRRAVAPGASRDQDLKHATKLLALFIQQLDALNRLRGKGQQKVTVEYVHIAPGAQAVVGNVETKSSGTKPHGHRPSQAVATVVGSST